MEGLDQPFFSSDILTNYFGMTVDFFFILKKKCWFLLLHSLAATSVQLKENSSGQKSMWGLAIKLNEVLLDRKQPWKAKKQGTCL